MLSPTQFAAELIEQRQTLLPKRLLPPGPDEGQTALIVGAAAAAPDHARLLPWRFVLVPQAARAALADAFESALVLRDPLALAAQREQAREKAFRAPLLLLAVVRLAGGEDPPTAFDEAREVPDAERIVSAGCAIQNMLLMATAMGFGSSLTSGKALQSAPLRKLFGLDPHEQALCFVNVGTPGQRKPGRVRPTPAQYLTTLEPPAA
jgi:nitroreductase